MTLMGWLGSKTSTQSVTHTQRQVLLLHVSNGFLRDKRLKGGNKVNTCPRKITDIEIFISLPFVVTIKEKNLLGSKILSFNSSPKFQKVSNIRETIFYLQKWSPFPKWLQNVPVYLKMQQGSLKNTIMASKLREILFECFQPMLQMIFYTVCWIVSSYCRFFQN